MEDEFLVRGDTVLALRPTANPELITGLARELERRGR